LTIVEEELRVRVKFKGLDREDLFHILDLLYKVKSERPHIAGEVVVYWTPVLKQEAVTVEAK